MFCSDAMRPQLRPYAAISEEGLESVSVLFLPALAINSRPSAAAANEFSASAETLTELGGALPGVMDGDGHGIEGMAEGGITRRIRGAIVSLQFFFAR